MRAWRMFKQSICLNNWGQHYSFPNLWLQLGLMVRHWIDLRQSTYCCTNGTGLCWMPLLIYRRLKKRVCVLPHLVPHHFLTISWQSCICYKRWSVGREKTPCIVPLHVFQCLDTHSLLQVLVGRLSQELPSDNSLLCFLPLHVLGLSAHQRTWFMAFLSWLRRKEAYILNAYVRLLFHWAARPSHTHPHWVFQGCPLRQSYSPLYFQKRWELDYSGSAMSGDERDATDGCVKLWESISSYFSTSVLPGHVPIHHLWTGALSWRGRHYQP